MSLPCAVPDARYSRSVNAQRRCVHRCGELGSTSGVDRRAVSVLMVLLVKRWDSKKVGKNLRLVGGGVRARAGVGGSARGGFRLMMIDEGVDDVLSVARPLE